MPVISNNVGRDDLERRRQTVLESVGASWADLSARREAGLLTPEEWEAWEELDGLNYLLGD